MKKFIVLLLLTFTIVSGCKQTIVEPEPDYPLYKDSKFKKLVILKADDFKHSHNIISDNWRRYIQTIISEKIKSSIGIIGSSLQGNNEYLSLIKSINASGSFEFWNHGYSHVLNGKYANGEYYDEFKNSGFRYQTDHLKLTQDLGKEKLNIIFHAFGAPGNAVDSNTTNALKKFNDIKIWFFGSKASNKIILKREADAEHPDGNPDFKYFINHFNVTNDYVVLQLHPNQWDERQFNEFKSIISFLKYNECTFILPSEYETFIKNR